MVLPWITDRRTPALRCGRLAFPYSELENDEVIFAVEDKHKLELKQSPFFRLRNPVAEIIRHKNSSEDTEHIFNFRKEHNDTYVPSSVLLNCMNEKTEGDQNKFLNRLSFKKNPKYSDQYIAIYPDAAKDSLVVDFFNEVELGPDQRFLTAFDSHEIDVPFSINSIRSFSGEAFAVSSSQTARIFSYMNDSYHEVFDYISPEDDYISCMDISRFSVEFSVLLKESKKLVVCKDTSNDEYTLSADFSNCSYSAHPSLLMLSGHSNQIELKDLRGVFTGLMISDLNVPFCSVNTLITHHNDPNLIAISCQTDVYSPVLSCDEITSEVRIYDIRYPKESTMRIAPDIPITQFITFESYGNGGHEFLLGSDAASVQWCWGARHSKSNVEFSDGVLSLTNISKFPLSYDSKHLLQDREYIGYSIDSCCSDGESLFFSRLADDGELEYCIISNNFSADPFPVEPSSATENIGQILDFSSLSVPILGHQFEEAQNASKNDFGPMLQSTFHLDFYWDELKTRLIENSNQ